MARFNVPFLFVILATVTVTISQSAPVHLAGRHSDEPGREIFDLPGRPLETKTPDEATENTGNQTEVFELPGKVLGVETASLQCNIARAVMITDLQDTAVLLEEIDVSNATVAEAVSEAKNGLQTAGTAIQGILTALISGQTPPADGGDETDRGLGVMLTAIAGLNSDDPNVQTTLLKIEDTIAAGGEVAATCR